MQTTSRNEPVIDDLLAYLFKARHRSAAILDNCQDERKPLSSVDRRMLQDELDAIIRDLDRASCVN